MQVEELSIPGPLLLTPSRFIDERGFFSETYSQRVVEASGITAVFVQENHSLSRPRGTVRGLHLQLAPYAQGKLIRVVRGAIFDVAVDVREGSPSFGRHVAVELTSDNWRQLWLPEGFAHGFCTLVPDTEVIYKVTRYYAPASEHGILWSDRALGIDWPVTREAAILSAKDRLLPTLAEFKRVVEDKLEEAE